MAQSVSLYLSTSVDGAGEEKAGKGSFFDLFREEFLQMEVYYLIRARSFFAGESISGGIWRICKSHYS